MRSVPSVDACYSMSLVEYVVQPSLYRSPTTRALVYLEQLFFLEASRLIVEK